MAETVVAPNNRVVRYRGNTTRERPRATDPNEQSAGPDALGESETAVPVVSKAQNRAMHAAEAGESTLGIPQSVGADFVAGQKPGALKGLPERKGKPKKAKKHHTRMLRSGAVSMAKMAKHFGKDQQPIDAASR